MEEKEFPKNESHLALTEMGKLTMRRSRAGRRKLDELGGGMMVMSAGGPHSPPEAAQQKIKISGSIRR